MKWRRLIGAGLMIVGGAMVIAMAALAGVVIPGLVHGDGGAEALGAVTAVTLLPAVGGAALMLAGRMIYGAWRWRAPVVNTVAVAIQIAGVVVAVALGVMLIFIIVTGITADDHAAAAALGIGTAAGLTLIFIGARIKVGSGRRYLD